MAKPPFPPFAKKGAPVKGKPGAKVPAKLCPGCKNPACKRMGKCAK